MSCNFTLRVSEKERCDFFCSSFLDVINHSAINSSTALCLQTWERASIPQMKFIKADFQKDERVSRTLYRFD